MMKKKIALFGGSFDPIHTDHVNIAKACYQKLGFDQVWLIPTFLNPFKSKQNSSVEHRMAMLEIIKNKYDFIFINDYEIKANRSVQTYETVSYMIEKYPEYEFCFIMGSDQLDRFEEWNNFDELIKLIKFKVFKRSDNYNKQIALKYDLEMFDFKNNNLSSTDIRNLINLDKQIPEINNYTNLNLLYMHERLEKHMDEKRYVHCKNVGQMSYELAKKWNVDAQKALVAGTLHDITKRWDKEKQEQYLNKYLPELLNEPFPVWHSYTGYLHLKYDWLIKDEEILNAVFNHTVGSKNMSMLDMIVFCADKISVERDYEGVEELRKLCFEDLEKGFKTLLENQYKVAIKKHGINSIGLKLIETVKHYLGEINE
ncbi:nicotinate-nucleotide adenylyltransferase [Mycoplasma sp. HU2014]|nr:nicotinate-nucleotide adenylyltransferase [Mycoplasma sp. HU2014]